MMPMWATVVFTIIMLLFTTAILALCLVIWGALLIRLGYSFRHLQTMSGTVLAIIFFGSFAWVFGIGAWKV
ncbi:MAG: hypothetical protein V3W44_01640, partial [Dehalococcoidales bacterium]